MLKRRVLVAVILMGLSSLSAVMAETGKTDQGREPLVWVGDWDSADGYMSILAKAYEEAGNPPIEVRIQGSSRGIRAVNTGHADIGGSGRNRLEGMPEEMRVELMPVAWDPLVVGVHPDNPVSDLSSDKLRAIYKGEVSNWKELGGHDAPIKPIHREDILSASGFLMRMHILRDSVAEITVGEAVDEEVDIAERVRTDVNAIAVMGFGSATRHGLKMLVVDGHTPERANIRSGEYLWYRPLYLVTHPGHKRREEVAAFRKFSVGASARTSLRQAGLISFVEAMQLIRKQVDEEYDARHAGYD